jgi:hypothetical protein
LSTGSAQRLERRWHDETLDVSNRSHQKDPIMRLIHNADWQLGKTSDHVPTWIGLSD